MKHSKNFLLLLLVVLVSSCGQDDRYEFEGIQVKMSVPFPLEESKFYEYDPPLLIQSTLKSLDDALCRTPEELLLSVKSATSQKWVKYNSLKETASVSPQDLNRLRGDADESEQYQLIHKFEFKHEGIETCIIKYFILSEGKDPVLSSLVSQKHNSRWYVVSDLLEVSKIANAIEKIKTEAFYSLAVGYDRHETGNRMFEALIENTRDSEQPPGLAIYKLSDEIDEIRSQGDADLMNQFIDF